MTRQHVDRPRAGPLLSGYGGLDVAAEPADAFHGSACPAPSGASTDGADVGEIVVRPTAQG